jgi:hypothetical protein
MPVAKALDKKWLFRELERDRKKKAREKIASLADQIREARKRRKLALREAKERCRAERIAARERARAMRLRVLEELREAMRAERMGARQACTVRLGEARGIKDSILRARAELQAEKKYEADLRRIERANRKRRQEAPRVTRIERQAESDDEVRSNLPPELVALFERVKRGIKASPRMSRTEAFHKYVEENPHEYLEAMEDKTEAMIRDLEKQHREAHRSLRRGPPRPRRGAAAAAAACPTGSCGYTAEQLAEVPF